MVCSSSCPWSLVLNFKAQHVLHDMVLMQRPFILGVIMLLWPFILLDVVLIWRPVVLDITELLWRLPLLSFITDVLLILLRDVKSR